MRKSLLTSISAIFALGGSFPSIVENHNSVGVSVSHVKQSIRTSKRFKSLKSRSNRRKVLRVK